MAIPTASAVCDEFEEENHDRRSDRNRKEQADGVLKHHQRVHLRREVGRLLRIQWQLRTAR